MDATSLEEYLTAAIQKEGKTQKQVALLVGKSETYLLDVMRGRRALTDEFALDLEAVGVGNAMEMIEIRVKAKRTNGADGRGQRLRLSDFRFTEMVKRNWIQPKGKDLASQLEALEGIVTVGRKYTQPHYRASLKAENLPCWIAVVRSAARRIELDAIYEKDRCEDLVSDVLECARFGLSEAERERAIRNLPNLFSRYGVRLVIVDQLPGMRVDGAYFKNAGSPIIALTKRFNRTDWFFYTLLHELGHLVAGHDDVVDQVDATSTDQAEVEADNFARESLISDRLFENWVRTVNPTFSAHAIRGFSEAIDREPSIVVGRLMREGYIPYSHHRALLTKTPDLEESKFDPIEPEVATV